MPLETLSQYDLLEKIASGPGTELYRGRDTRTGVDVAIKVFFQGDLSMLRLLQIEQTSALAHSSFPKVYAVGKHERKMYVVMEYVEGDTLKDLIASGQSGSLDFNSIALQLAQGLNAAHSLGIVHRDVKPANILINPEGVVKIIDFGLARVTDPATGDDIAFVGTPAYMAPEALLEGRTDERSDIFSFGATLYELVTGELLPRTLPPVSLMRDHELKNLDRLTRAPISNELKTIILRSIRTSLYQRYQSFAEIITDLTFSERGSLQMRHAVSAYDLAGNLFALSRAPEGLNSRRLFAAVALITTLSAALGGLILGGGTSLGFGMAFGGGVLAYECYLLLRATQ